MKTLKVAATAVAAMFLLTGCLYTHVLTPLDRDVDKTVLGHKEGRASVQSVLGLVAWGDGSTAAAAKQGGITTIDHMDQEVYSILFGIYTETTTIVYGD